MKSFFSFIKRYHLFRVKKLFEFSRLEALCFDKILYLLYSYKNVTMRDSDLKSFLLNFEFSNAKIDTLIIYLATNHFCIITNDLNVHEEKIKCVILNTKGKVICEQGGLFMLWEKQNTQNYSKWISIISAFIAVCALIANILFSYLKECQ